MKASLDFACDYPTPAQRGELAAAICATPPNWALLDLAVLDAVAVHERMRRSGWKTYSAYASSSLEAFAEHAAWLVALESEPAAQFAQARSLLDWTAGSSALSFLYTVAPLTQLQGLAGYLARVMLEDRKQPLHCRFADTRVLPNLLSHLDAAQQVRVQATVGDWGWVDRHAAYVRWQPRAATVAADTSRHLRLTVEQFRALRAGSDADAIFTLLLEQTPSLVPADHRGQFHSRLCGFLQTADTYRVLDLESRLQFVVLSLTCGEDFHRLPGLAGTWAGVLAGDYTLAERMPLWENHLWNQLESNPPWQGGAPSATWTA